MEEWTTAHRGAPEEGGGSRSHCSSLVPAVVMHSAGLGADKLLDLSKHL